MVTLSGSGGTTKVVDVPEWGGKVEVRSVSVRNRARLLEMQTQIVDPPEGKSVGECLAAYQAALVIATCRDPESGEPCFTDDQTEALLDEDAAVFDEVVKAASQVCGFAPDTENDLGKD